MGDVQYLLHLRLLTFCHISTTLKRFSFEFRPLAVNPAAPCSPINLTLQCNSHTFFGHFQEWWPHHFPWQPIPGLDNLTVRKVFLIFNLNLPRHSLRSFSLVLSLVNWENRPSPTCLQPPFRSSMRSPEPPFLQAKHPQTTSHIICASVPSSSSLLFYSNNLYYFLWSLWKKGICTPGFWKHWKHHLQLKWLTWNFFTPPAVQKRANAMMAPA